jgi:hypothetical protein
MVMNMSALWSKILIAVAVMLTVGGWILILGLGLWSIGVNFVISGNILAVVGAVLSRSSRRKLVLWGAGGTAIGTALGIARVTYTAWTDREPPVPPVIFGVLAFAAKLLQVLIVAGAIYILLEPKRSAPHPSPNSFMTRRQIKSAGVHKRALWSKIIGIAALMLMVVGIGLIMGGGRKLEYGGLWVLGIILAVAAAIMSRCPSRKLVFWGAGGTAAAMAPGLILGLISGLRGQVATPDPNPAILVIIVVVGILSEIAIGAGVIGLLLDRGRPASPPTSSGTGDAPTGAAREDPMNLHSPAELKRLGRKKGLVWGAATLALLLLVAGIFLVTRGGEKSGEPEKPYAEGQSFAVGSTREEVLRIQGPPTFKLEMVWFYEDSQVQFDSDGKVTNLWNISKNLKVRSEKRP